MRHVGCDVCGNNAVPLNNSVTVDGKIYCGSCFESHFPDEKLLEGKLVDKDIDPTICSSCGKDFGDKELAKISTYPVCPDCEVEIKNRTFPTWVKAFFVAILVIVVFSSIWNWKYYRAYNDIKQSFQLFQQGDVTNASLRMKAASDAVPEVEDLSVLASYFKGVELLSADKSDEAMAEFEKCRGKLPEDYPLEKLIVQARIGSSFDKGDYDGFLAASKENLAFDTTLAVSLTSVASAYACLYARDGEDGSRQQAVAYLTRARQIDSTSEEMTQYYNMVEYRLDSRNVIRREEFIKRYPNGWTKN